MGKYKVDERLLEYKDIVISGKKGKPSQLYSLYIFRVLTEDANYFNPLKCTEIIDKITERFNVVIDLSTIQRYINTFKQSLTDYVLEGDAYDGYYLNPTEDAAIVIPAEERLDSYYVNLLVQTIRGLDYVKEFDKEKILMSLSYMGDKDLQKYIRSMQLSFPRDQQFRGMGKRWSILGQRELQSYILENLPEIVSQQLIVLITAKEQLKHKIFITHENKEMCIYFTMPIGTGAMYLVGRLNDDNKLVSIRIDDIKDFNILDKTFERKPIRVYCRDFYLEGDIREYFEAQKDTIFIFPTTDEISKFKAYDKWVKGLSSREQFKQNRIYEQDVMSYLKYPKK